MLTPSEASDPSIGAIEVQAYMQLDAHDLCDSFDVAADETQRNALYERGMFGRHHLQHISPIALRMCAAGPWNLAMNHKSILR